MIALIYCYPVLEGKKLKQSDIIQFQGMSKEIVDYRAETGEEPLWTNSMFGGMPAFQISTLYPQNLLNYIHKLLYVLPHPVPIFFLLMLGMYVFLITAEVSPLISSIGALAYALSTFFIVSIEAGHNSKITAVAYLPMVLAGILMIFNKKYLLGLFFTAFVAALHINANHFQITYYLSFIILLYVLAQIYRFYKEKRLKEIIRPLSIATLAGILAISANFARLWTTYDFTKETMRGGKSELTTDTDNKSTGLNKDYAMRWSQGKIETLSFLFPSVRGGSSNENLGKESYLYKEMINKGVPANQAKGFVEGAPLYWGDKPFTSGPHYLGIITCFLVILGFITIKGYVRWWLLSASVLGIMLAWGRHWEWFTDLFFYYVPMYNKFRAPEITLVIPTVCMIILAFLGFHKFLAFNDQMTERIKILKQTLYITAGFIILIIIVMITSDYTANVDNQLGQNQWLVELLRNQREKILLKDIFKSIVLVAMTFGILLMYVKRKLKRTYSIIAIGLLIFVDLLIVDKRYLNKENFVKPRNYENLFQPTETDLAIMQDKNPNYRVFNLTTNTFNDAMTSYHHKSIGGYHGAKLIKYQDMIDYHLSKNNINVINMMNAKYFIIPVKESGKSIVQKNPNALGNAWLVKNIKWVNNADDEIESLNEFTPEQTAVIDKRYTDVDISSRYTGQGTLQLVEYKPNKLTYEYDIEAPQFAVFSEIFYKGNEDWKAYVDGKYINHYRVNYILRGMELPAGRHTIMFKFEPRSYYLGGYVSLAGSAIILLGFIGSLIHARRTLI